MSRVRRAGLALRAGRAHRRGALPAIGLALCLAIGRATGAEQELTFRAGAIGDAATTAAIRDLAVRTLPVYQEGDRERYLSTLSALQIAAGDFAAAHNSLQNLSELRGARGLSVEEAVNDVYARARALTGATRLPLGQAVEQALRERTATAGDLPAYRLGTALQLPTAPFARSAQQLLDRWRDRGSLPMSVALTVCRAYANFDAHRAIAAAAAQPVAQDQARRYQASAPLQVHLREGLVALTLVLPRTADRPLPAVLSIADASDAQALALASAAHDYVGVAVDSAGLRGRTPNLPFEHEGELTRAVIDWITRQPWSDGRVALYGRGYGGYIAWVAALRAPRALQAVIAFSPMAPGIDIPASGGIYRNAAYHWLRSMTLPSRADDADAAQRAFDLAWYRSGRSYRQLGLGHATVPAFDRWLEHPSYDAWWQRAQPATELTHLAIPVLMLTGYFDAHESGALYDFSAHQAAHAGAEDTLLIGPYDFADTDEARNGDDGLAHGDAPASVRGLAVDAAAALGADLHYAWLDYILKGRPKPPLFAAGVNYELMGANAWQHAASLATLAATPLRLYLDSSGNTHRLLAQQPADAGSGVDLQVDLAVRHDTDTVADNLQGRGLAVRNGVVFSSDPLPAALDVAGLPQLLLDFSVNRQDMDLYFELYEQLADGTYLRLGDPREEVRASYAQDRSRRHLLKAGERQTLALHGQRMIGRRVAAGSRLILVLGVNQRPDEETNYGTGGDVSVEAIADAHPPLKVRWFSDSYLELPVHR
jgi:putative CocE/NonD family hydrolase